MSVFASPKHGLNPSVSVCFWCGKECGLVVFGLIGHKVKNALGIDHGVNDPEAPRKIIEGSSPCETCREFASRGLVTIRAINLSDEEVLSRGFIGSNGNIDLENNINEIYKLLHPMVWRIKLEAFLRVVTGVNIGTNRFVFISIEAAQKLGLPMSVEIAEEMGFEGDVEWLKSDKEESGGGAQDTCDQEGVGDA